jgi:hypothetical protein
MMILALSLPGMAQAHFIRIETESMGKPDTPVEISLFYGEPHEFLREESPGKLDRHAGRQGERASLARGVDHPRLQSRVTIQVPWRFLAQELVRLSVKERNLDRGIGLSHRLGFDPDEVSLGDPREGQGQDHHDGGEESPHGRAQCLSSKRTGRVTHTATACGPRRAGSKRHF